MVLVDVGCRMAAVEGLVLGGEFVSPFICNIACFRRFHSAFTVLDWIWIGWRRERIGGFISPFICNIACFRRLHSAFTVLDWVCMGWRC